LRIVSGSYRGRIIKPPKNLKARPTTDFAKESLFNILANYFDFTSVDVLDLFSGTGSIGLEFASRGAKSVEMVENNFTLIEFIRKTLSDLDIHNAQIIRNDVFRHIGRLRHSFDIIFADPPYDLERIASLPTVIFSNQVLRKNGWFILEHGRNLNFKDDPNCFDHRNYGSVNFSFFKKP
jgi:16S rRNA (guanine(966)-N(2))-methyltransferase RsmD